jgi:hypothetical protein
VFVEYNNCNNEGYTNYEKKEKGDLFNLNIRLGLNSSSLSLRNDLRSSRNVDFDNQFGYRLGVEVEAILPFNKNKWAVIIEPTLRQKYNSEKSQETNDFSGGIINSKVNYQSIEIPLGARHYFYLNDNSKIFVNVSFIFDVNNKSSVEYTRSNGTLIENLEISSRSNMAYGLGYKHNNKYSLELRYHTREVLGGYTNWRSDYITWSAIIAYSLF